MAVNKLAVSFIAPILLSALCHSVIAQAALTPPGDVAAQLDAAMMDARKFDLKPSYALSKQQEQVLPLLKMYANDSSPGIHEALSFFAGLGHSNETATILSALVAQRYQSAVDDLYRSYSPAEIQIWGGSVLRQNLIKYLQAVYIGEGSPSSIKALMLLAAFSPSPDVRGFLIDLRDHGLTHTVNVNGQGFIIKRPVQKKAQLLYAAPVELSLPVDMVLSEEGDKDAVDRVVNSVRQGDIDGTLVFVIETARFIRQKPILLEMVGLLQDKRPTRLLYQVMVEPEPEVAIPALKAPISASAQDIQDNKIRVCDLALAALAENTGVDVGIPDLMLAIRKDPRTFPKRRYSDAELKKAYLALKAFLSAKPVPLPGKAIEPK